MEIRLIRPQDRDEWLRMRNLLWDDPDDGHETETLRYFAQADETVAVFVIDRLDGRLGGFIEVGQRNYAEGCESSPVGYIEGWFIDADLRRQGYGAALVKVAEEWAKARGFREMASDALIENEISIRAHKALGYTEEERIVCFRKDLIDNH